MPPAPLVDPQTIDTSRVVLDRDGIRRYNPQRFEMEQLTAIVHLDMERKLIVGYKDILPDEFWVRGHLPDFPLMPGVLICEAAAQLASCYCKAAGFSETGFVGFGGMEDVRFRGQVRPGDRLLLVGKGASLRRRYSTFEVQGFVGPNMVFHGKVLGVTIATPGDSPG
jgi:3-hydroxyacyl-[acyl-carrier-protein] dehydratase